ncbi:putative bleomycin hydrolase [Elsinoe ampelina]|uniref:Cysteine proteinase 1, mitochondrial n=1 Tax=Elsinoe ampelina TaxID=302913 RepID=A0A6A6GP88_9PEZI|nr:putative bleomycin hydrolase [Elsinoe ampelina]
MGNTPSVPAPRPAVAQHRRAAAPRRKEEPVVDSFDEKRAAAMSFAGDGEAKVADGAYVSANKTSQLVEELLQDPKNRLALSALSTNNPSSILEIPSTILKDTQHFNVAIPLEGTPVTNQRSSGRCWIFAATNVFRIALMKTYNLPAFELSQSYLFFWDKVEKANYFLESILATADEEVDSRIISALMASPVGDGGQWDMIANLVSKYGLVPQVLYPDSYNAMNSRTMDSLITTKLREDALKLRQLVNNGTDNATLQKTKDSFMQDIVRILTLTLGPPPPADKKFTWEFYDTSHKLHTVSKTPLEFASSLSDSRAVRALNGTDVHSLFSLVNDPRNDYGTLLTVNKLGNVWGGRPITYVNVDSATLKEAAVAMIKKGLPVFFGSDVGKFSDSSKGIMDVKLVDYELGFNVRLGMTKAQRLQTGESAMTHAMVLTAVHLDEDGNSVRWRVENSWSNTAGDKGYFVASDAWMDEFCYQAVVDPSVVSKEVADILKQKPKVLPLWDPMGALA